MTYDYFLFDLDNCLLNIQNPGKYFDYILLETLKKLCKKPFKSLPERQERNTFWGSGKYYLKILENWGISDGSLFWKIFDEIDLEYRKRLLKTNNLNLYEDVITVLERLNSNGKIIGLVSNTADYIVEYILDYFDINKYFQETLGLSYEKDQEIAKPSPIGILSILRKLNYDNTLNKAVMIGDSMVDVLAAKRAGIIACLIKRDLNKYTSKDDWEYRPDMEIEHLCDIYKLI
ncbi:MAG: HAD family hydrolase [Promethearchaeota archaeon]